MPLSPAARIVIADTRESYPDMTDDDALDFVAGNLSIADLNPDSDTYAAYVEVLALGAL